MHLFVCAIRKFIFNSGWPDTKVVVLLFNYILFPVSYLLFILIYVDRKKTVPKN